MKKILPVVLIIVLVGGGLYFIKQKQSPPPSTNTQTNKSILDWLKGKQGVRCELDMNGSQVVVLAKENKIKVIGQTLPIGEQVQKGNMINDGQWIYVWNEESDTGIKYNIKEQSESETTQPYSFEEVVAQWNNYKYQCQPQKIDDQEFVPPANVKFIDLDAMREQIQNATEKAQENAQEIEEKLKDFLGK